MDNMVAITGCALALLLWWVVIPARAVLHDRRLATLASKPCVEPSRWPSISVLVPARNEEHTLADAVHSLLQVDYPDLEIILINDRSTDRTGDVVEELAQRDTRIRTLHLDTLPAGWLGKVHALHQGCKMSRAEWLLFTDADIHFSASVLKQAVAYSLQQKRDFLALFPGFSSSGLVTGSTQAAFGVMLLSMLDFARASDPDSDLAMGVGAFNLMRRSCIDEQQGLEWLRMELADDVGLALMAKRAGASIEVLAAQDLLQVDWYPTLTAMLNGVMQRFIMGANYSLARYLLNCVIVVFCLVAPVGLGFALSFYGPLAWLSLLAYGLPSLILGAGLGNIVMPRRLLWGLPLGFALIAYGMLRSFVSCLRHGGVFWRGNLYPLRELRAAQRVKMGNFS